MKNYTVKFDGTQYAFDKKLKLELGILGSERDGQIQYDMQRCSILLLHIILPIQM